MAGRLFFPGVILVARQALSNLSRRGLVSFSVTAGHEVAKQSLRFLRCARIFSKGLVKAYLKRAQEGKRSFPKRYSFLAAPLTKNR